MPGASKQRARMCRACECVGCALDATTPVTVGAITIVGVEVSGAAVVLCVGVVVTVSSVTAGDMSYWILLPPYHILPSTKIARCVGGLCTSSGWFKHIEPTSSNLRTNTEIAMCVGCLCTSSGWFSVHVHFKYIHVHVYFVPSTEVLLNAGST